MECPPSKRFRSGSDTSNTTTPETSNTKKCVGINDLPVEILTKIFKYYVKGEGLPHFLYIISSVCALWRDIVESPPFWTHVENSSDIPLEALQFLSERNAFRRTKSLTLHNIMLHDCTKVIETLRGCPDLKTIHIESCAINGSVITYLAEFCPELEELNLKNVYKCLFPGPYFSFFREIGANLRRISLYEVQLKNVFHFLRVIAKFCSNLVELSLVKLHGRKLIFPIAAMQKGCLQLETLELRELRFSLEGTEDSSGFINLISFTCTTRIEDKTLFHLLKGSRNLQILDLGYTVHSVQCVLKLPINNLKVFRTSAMHMRPDSHQKLLERWPNLRIKAAKAPFSRNVWYHNRHIYF